jgi:hypothetical protein
MNRNVPPIPMQLVVSVAVALVGIIAYVAALLIEEEQRSRRISLGAVPCIAVKKQEEKSKSTW